MERSKSRSIQRICVRRLGLSLTPETQREAAEAVTRSPLAYF